jgi:predicted ferric reductase
VLGALCVVALWWVNTGTSSRATPDLAVAVGRLAGLLASYCALLLIVITARIEPLERRVGSARLAHLHGVWGKATVVLVLLHACAISLGYAGLVHVAVASEVRILVVQYPYVGLALVAALILGLVGVLSVRTAMQGIGYQTWYRIHLLTYAAVALAFAHQVAVGSDFVHDPVSRAAWTAMYVLVALVVAYYRVWRPVVRAVGRRSRVVALLPEGDGTVSVSIRSTGSLSRVGPGQFFRLRFLARGLWSESHPFSVSALPAGDQLRFTVKERGRYTRRLQTVAPGTRVLLMGPYGSRADHSHGRDALLVGAGIGITALRPLFELYSAKGFRATLLYRCRSMQDLPLRDELDDVAATWGTTVVYLPGPRALGENALRPADLVQLVPDVADREVYVCAPPGLTQELARSLQAVGVPPRQVHREAMEPVSPAWPAATRLSVGVLVGVGLLSLLAVRAGPARHPVNTAYRMTPERSNGLPASGLTSSATITVDGPVERTLYNSVQVRVVVRAGRLVDVRALMLPSVDARSRQLSALAGPILAREALASNGVVVDAVSGASYTSGAYAQSLQAALDQARSQARP